jgi:hypothetical protein
MKPASGLSGANAGEGLAGEGLAGEALVGGQARHQAGDLAAPASPLVLGESI